MNEEILGLVKFGARQNIYDFRRNGTIYMNTLEYFRTLEGKGDVGDKDEGLGSCWQSNRVSVKITNEDKKSITLSNGNGLTGQIITRDNGVDSSNLFCMYAIKYCGKKSVIDERNLAFGDTYVCITNSSMFIERLRAAAKKARVHITGRLVEYVPRNDHNGEMGVFRKFLPYSYQSEYRIIISPGFSTPYKLIIGDISDITTSGKASEINDHIEHVELDAV
jgi:hypothetical protein